MPIPTPYAGSYYPIYNSGTNQYIPPSPGMPFNKISTLFFAFAHAYPTNYDYEGNVTQSALALEAGQPLEAFRIAEVMTAAKEANPGILCFISLGWGKNDWTYINADYEAFISGKTQSFNFAQSVVQFLEAFNLDGFDIDDESINQSSGSISQANFSAVLGLIRKALNDAPRTYYFSITPAFGTAMITNDNIVNFDLINTQNYGDCSYSDFESFPNAHIGMFAYGIDSEGGGTLPSKQEISGMAGVFNWTLSADSNSNPPYAITNGIAQLVGYKGQVPM